MKKKLLLFLNLCLFAGISTFAYDAEIDGIYYNLSGNEAIVTYNASNLYSGDVVIPASVIYNGNTYSVISVGIYAFERCYDLTSITIPNSVKSIANWAFNSCGLTSITIPNSVEGIGEYAFKGCSRLTSVAIGNSVTSIGQKAFYDCKNLNAVHITDLAAWCGISFGKGSNLMYYAKHLYLNGQEIIGHLDIPDGVTSIGNLVFDSCIGLTSVTIPSSVTSIGEAAFYGCTSLISVIIPSSVTSIGGYVFAGCSSLADIYCYAEEAPNANSNAFSNLPISSATLHVPTGSVSAYREAAPWSGFGSIQGYFITFADTNVKALCVANWDTDGDGELNINEAAAVKDLEVVFKGNKQIESFDELQFFTGLESISNSAFNGCSNLKSIYIPENVTVINNYAFQQCSSLESINIPQSMTTIGVYAFSGCSSLTAVNITDLTAWCKISFGNSIAQPLSNAHHLYLNGREIMKLNIPNGVVEINDFAFKGCTGLTSVIFSSSVLSIGNNAFNDCGGLTTVYIPNSMMSIGSYAFYKCLALTDVYCYTEEVPNTNTNAFSNSPIGSATLHVLDIAEEAYRTTAPWSNFGTIVTISPYIAFADPNVKAICVANWDINDDGEMTYEEAAAVSYLSNAFTQKQISSFDELQYFTGLTNIDDNAFKKCYNLTSVTIPENVTRIDNSAFYGCSGLTSVTIPASVDSIGNSTFYSCSGLTSITIPENVMSIGASAFNGCSGLTSITIPGNVMNIGKTAFEGCNLRSVLVKCAIPPTSSVKDTSTSPALFSRSTCHHATLYVPAGCWDTYAFADHWNWFINIRETALEEEQVSEQQAYTLMNAGTFAYSVYDPVNDCIGTINSVSGINEDNPNHSWQMIEAGGMRYLYNIGAKKYVKRSDNGLDLTETPEPIEVEDGNNGIILGAQATQQWALVSNEHMSVAQSAIDEVTAIVSPIGGKEDGAVYNLIGQRIHAPQKGLNIINGRKVLIK